MEREKKGGLKEMGGGAREGSEFGRHRRWMEGRFSEEKAAEGG